MINYTETNMNSNVGDPEWLEHRRGLWRQGSRKNSGKNAGRP